MTSLQVNETRLTPLATRLYATPASPLPFMAGVQLRSFVLDGDDGPVVIYNSAGINAAANDIRELGAPSRLLINHYHEGMAGTPNLDVPVLVHERDRRGTERAMRVDDTINGRTRLSDDLEAIPSLAHTPGATLYLWDNGEHRFLFPGDSFWVEDGIWRAVILGESNRKAFLDTLSLMCDLDFDILVPWPAQQGMPALNSATAEQKTEQIDNLIARIRDGATGPSS